MHNSIIPVVCLILISICTASYNTVNSQNLLSGPESVVYDSIHDRYLVSNMYFPYYITAIDHDGSYSVFNSQLEWPHGMTIVDNIVYVTSNVGLQGGIVGLDIDSGEKVYEHLSPSWNNAIYSNLTVDTSGNLYFGVNNFIHRLHLADDISYQLQPGFIIPNGIHFDARNNRVLVPCEVWGTAIYAINASDYSVETITVDSCRYSCITEDQIGNFYISSFWENEIYKFDSNLNNRELHSNGYSGPEAIYFDKLHSTLLVPNLLANRIDFIPMDIDLWITPDVSVGWTPFEVTFGGASIYDISSWSWDFGDGYTSEIQSPIHIFETPGLFDITLRAVTAAGDTLTRIYPRHIFGLADSLWIEDIDTPSKNNMEIVIRARVSVPVQEIQIPIEFSGDLNLVYDTFSTFGCFTDNFGSKSVIEDPDGKKVTFNLKPRMDGSPLFASPNSGPVIKVYFHALDAENNQQTPLNIEGYDPENMPRFYANGMDYGPIISSGSLEFSYSCGDANTDTTVNVGDAVYLINYVFKSGPSPVPLEAGDSNCDDAVNVGDAVYLINFVFKSGPSPCTGCE